MIVTYNWLKEYVDIDVPPEELADLLTMLGLEVERMERLYEGMDEVIVALVQEKLPHPNADKLSLCTVNSGSELLSVVCGAQNFKAGDKVALAQVGAVLPGNFKIKKSKIRGEESSGMLCSEKELGLADDSAGIMILPQDLQLGQPALSALGLKDTIFEIGLTPNRADCLSVIGVAREIAAKLGKKVRYPGLQVAEGEVRADSVASVIVEDPQLCPRYTARYVSGCTIAPSPAWLVNRLQSVGMRSINNVVDVTNYVLLEYGHPLHAFDFDLLKGGRIIVRRAGEGEEFGTLDGQSRSLHSSDLTIRDGERAVALAGIMGGENSEIRPETVNILLESAYFSPGAVRRTSKRLGLHTESSHRFERGTDINQLIKALDRAASLIAEFAGGTVARGVIDVYPHEVPLKKVTLRLDRVNKLLGVTLKSGEVTGMLTSLEFGVETVEPGIYQVTVPSFRVDIEREIDLVEEIARLNGFEKIPVTMPKARVFSDRAPLHQRLESSLRNILVSNGFNEVINFSFISPEVYDKLLLPPDHMLRQSVRLLNPLVEEQSVMRTTLLPGLLETAFRNFSFRTMDLRIFELRRVYIPHPERELPDEPVVAAGLLAGRRDPEGWNQPKGEVDFYDVKGVVEHVLSSFNIHDAVFEAADTPCYLHPGRSCRVLRNGMPVGVIGELHPTVQENFGLEKQVYYFEINFNNLITKLPEAVAITPPPRFPDTFRDIAMLVPDEMSASDITRCIGEMKTQHLQDIEVFDVYKGAPIAEGQKSIAVRVRYRSAEKTLTDEEVNRIHASIIEKIVKKLNVYIR